MMKRRAAPWMIVTKDIHKLEHDAASQYKFNRFWTIVWALAMVGLLFDQNLYDHSISALIITEVSLWANLATHFSGMSAALAAMNTSKTLGDTTDVVEDLSDNVDDIHDKVISQPFPLAAPLNIWEAEDNLP